ncbi:hypothetical protein [Streptomyces sp. NPDC048611]|uniref:hypothetical protein n=1 Tax=Streptomyces sp. NPDC048611 TaxID=3155635 RepID=UPI0034253354
MKISRIEPFLARPRRLFVRVETDEGVVGWGEPVAEGRAEPVRAAVEVLSEYLLGPVHQLLGGPVREKIRAYAWVGGDEPHALRDAVTAQTEAGFSAVKMNGCGRMTPVATRAEVRG